MASTAPSRRLAESRGEDSLSGKSALSNLDKNQILSEKRFGGWSARAPAPPRRHAPPAPVRTHTGPPGPPNPLPARSTRHRPPLHPQRPDPPHQHPLCQRTGPAFRRHRPRAAHNLPGPPGQPGRAPSDRSDPVSSRSDADAATRHPRTRQTMPSPTGAPESADPGVFLPLASPADATPPDAAGDASSAPFGAHHRRQTPAIARRPASSAAVADRPPHPRRPH